MRLDKYLKVSRIIKRRTVANDACDTEHVVVNGRRAKASYDVKEGDVIVGFNGKVIKSMAELNALKDSFRPGDNVSVKVWRDDKEFEIAITLTEAF